MSVITRRRFVAAALAATTIPVPARSARAQTAVKIGTAVLGEYAMAGPVIVALERGFFKSEGLAAEFVPFRGGPDLLKAVMAGECLVGITGSTDILVFREAGSPIKMIATHTESNHFTLNVAQDVQRVGDLKGKAIGVTRVGATTWVFARTLAKKEGWDSDKDVQVVGLGGLDAQLAAMARKISGPLLPVDGQINAEALVAMQETLLEHGLIKKKLPLADHYTREFTPVRV